MGNPCIGRIAAVLAIFVPGCGVSAAQSVDIDAARGDLAAASRILAAENVLDAFGHVSMRDPRNSSRYLMPRSIAPALTTADDIITFDFDSNAVDGEGKALFLERFIHGEIYRRRPDVKAIVHSHSPAVIPFGLVKTPLQAMFRNAAFLAYGVPVFDIHDRFGDTDMLVRNREIGSALADTLGDKAVALMSGHGNVVTAPTLPLVVFRAVYTELNARIQSQAMALGGPVRTLTQAEGEKAEVVNAQIVLRAWELWKKNVEKK